ncbi:hypothetical protein LTR09_009433 [Extremus antarcticus]|uniref:Amidohydrolase-related domain-containing protein n=1 Tax=Extremus antarcticus TaxID=702011 RepID=A0AAJ0DFJ7_9PEZI|nr:hypothetical protein LTR09_009433 [Extremus antarcticus]
MIPPLITLEEHYFSTAAINTLDDKMVEQFKHIPGLKDKLTDAGQLRLSEMDKGKVSFQIISHACVAGAPSLDVCREGNDQLANDIKNNRDRFAGFAVLPMADPQECANELERTVKQLGFVGAMIDNHVHGKYYDGNEYDVFWAKAQDLDVAIYLHPTWPSDNMNPQYTGNFPESAGRSMGASGWGWHTETGLHILRLFAAGVFDKFPKLKIIIGHFGEMLPFQLQRICNLSVRWGERERKLKQVWDENIWITTSGVWSLDPLRCILGNTKIDHILYSVDYPFAKNEEGLEWVEKLEKSGLLTQEQLEMVAYRNAEKLLNVKAPART